MGAGDILPTPILAVSSTELRVSYAALLLDCRLQNRDLQNRREINRESYRRTKHLPNAVPTLAQRDPVGRALALLATRNMVASLQHVRALLQSSEEFKHDAKLQERLKDRDFA